MKSLSNLVLGLPFRWMVVAVNVGGNLLGFFLIQLLLLYAQPLEEWDKISAFAWKANIGLLAILLPSAIYFLLILSRPVHQAIRTVHEERALPPELMNSARRRAVNIPFQAAAMNLVAWIMPAVVLPFLFELPPSNPVLSVIIYVLYSFSNALMITLLVFVFLESACRRTAIPVLFPHGKIRDQKGTMALTIRNRLMILYGAMCLIPMFQTALMINADASFALRHQDACVALRNLGSFSLILFAFTAIYGLWLAMLSARNLAEPAREIMAVTERVRSGDYESHVRVVSNDELGYLGDRVNEMTRGLKDRERIRQVFNLFTSPEISTEILSGRVAEGGEIRRVTLLFSDLRGFTAMAERLPPEQVVTSINSYFSAMSDAIVASGGNVLQYVGDEIEAVFGAPLDDPSHADKAVAASVEMRARLAALNKERRLRGEEPFCHGIGIHTGLALAGIVGSKHKISYAMVGDTVNVASRIQELNKDFGTDILVSEETYRSLSGTYSFSEPVRVSVKGKMQSLLVYKLTD